MAVFRAFLRRHGIEVEVLADAMGYSLAHTRLVLTGLKPVRDVFREGLRYALIHAMKLDEEEVNTHLLVYENPLDSKDKSCLE